MTGQPFRHEPRQSFTARERAELFADANGHCAECKRKIGAGELWDLDHIIALANGGTNDPSNLQVLCPFCHSAKTKGDVSDAAKGKRTAIKHTVPKQYRQGRGWRR